MKHQRAEILVVVVLLLGIVVAFRELPRYEWLQSKRYDEALIRIDHWTGEAQLGVVDVKWGRWVSMWELRADARAKASVGDTSALVDQIDRAVSTASESSGPRTSVIAFGSLILWMLGVACGRITRGAPFGSATATEHAPLSDSSPARSVARIVVGVSIGLTVLVLLGVASWNGLLSHQVALALDWTVDIVLGLALFGLLVYAGIWLYRSAANPPGD